MLHVEVEALAGRPWQYAVDVKPSSDASSLRTRAAEAHKRYQAARYEDLVTGLPDLLFAADSLHRVTSKAERRETLLSYASSYVVAAKLLTKMGAADLAQLAADRCATAALDADSLEAQRHGRLSSCMGVVAR